MFAIIRTLSNMTTRTSRLMAEFRSFTSCTIIKLKHMCSTNVGLIYLEGGLCTQASDEKESYTQKLFTPVNNK